jgi:hypothetical protein
MMTTNNYGDMPRRATALPRVLGAAAFLLVSGCGDDNKPGDDRTAIEKLCDDRVACEMRVGEDEDVEQARCLDLVGDVHSCQTKHGCASEFDGIFDCWRENATTCSEHEYMISPRVCREKVEQYAECMLENSPGRVPFDNEAACDDLENYIDSLGCGSVRTSPRCYAEDDWSLFDDSAYWECKKGAYSCDSSGELIVDIAMLNSCAGYKEACD